MRETHARDVAGIVAHVFGASFNSSAARFIAMVASVKPSAGSFADQLLHWHAQHGRHDLPWQTTPPDAYRVWVSEIMLQQTQVQTVIPYFMRFTQRFPTVHDLARASEQEVLALWSGLGYYQRARNLHACAQTIVAQHQGVFPTTADALAGLPGIGPSTAAAIASTVFQERVAILDGNVKRVLARVTRCPLPWASPAMERALWQEARLRLPYSASQMPRYTQAIMDLGATVCRTKTPSCTVCPVASHCAAFQHGDELAYPVPRPKRRIPLRYAYWCVPVEAQHVWLVQHPTTGIWPGLWVPWALDRDALPANWPHTAAHLREVITIRHTFSHYRLEIEAGILDWPNAQRPPRGAPNHLRRFTWLQALDLPLPAPVKQLLTRLCPSEKASDAVPRRRSPR